MKHSWIHYTSSLLLLWSHRCLSSGYKVHMLFFKKYYLHLLENERKWFTINSTNFFYQVSNEHFQFVKKLGYLKLEWQSSHHDIKSHFKQKILLAFLLCLIARITSLLLFLLIFFWWLRHGVVINCGGQWRPHISPEVVDMQWSQERRQYSYFIAIFFFIALMLFSCLTSSSLYSESLCLDN